MDQILVWLLDINVLNVLAVKLINLMKTLVSNTIDIYMIITRMILNLPPKLSIRFQ